MSSIFSLWAAAVILVVVVPTARGAISGIYVPGHFAMDPALADTEAPDGIAVTNEGPHRILRFGMYLAAGADADGNGLGLFFDTRTPNAQAPPAAGQNQPGYDGAARLRVEPASASQVGYVAGSELFVAFPGTLSLPDGDGAVQLVTIVCDHFDPGETVWLGIDVDGFDDFSGQPSGGVPPPGVKVAMGQAMVDTEGQVYFDIVSGAPPQPAPVPLHAPWMLAGAMLMVLTGVIGIRARARARFW
jgi:hypothetical protein